MFTKDHPPHDYYVYEHRRSDTGSVFYVGKGSGSRAWDVVNRPDYWFEAAFQSGYTVHIVEHGLVEWAAFEIEYGLISMHGRAVDGTGPLVNRAHGGGGVDVDRSRAMAAAIERRAILAAEEADWQARLAASGYTLRMDSILCIEAGITFKRAKDAAAWLSKSRLVRKPRPEVIERSAAKGGKRYGFSWKQVERIEQ